MSLKSILQANGIESEMLDELVDDAAQRQASRINNEGMSEQLSFLEAQAVTDDTILKELEIDQ
ncbi:hypothetical protein A3715_15230 [Oleiphilus sp. HI0009]|nr:hypothetical protein A3715_15865 [Oleiphilus sp. HI0009]KZX74668.1 hypothetical protein A3715_15230 [Oleiphilus sp. HI0009]